MKPHIPKPRTKIEWLDTLPIRQAHIHPDPSLKLSDRVSEYSLRTGKVFRTRRVPAGRRVERLA